MAIKEHIARGHGIALARVLVVNDDPTARLTLQTVLKAGGYDVDAAASAAEAVGLLDQAEYELVLSDLQMESPEAGFRVLDHARAMQYRPATAILTAESEESSPAQLGLLVQPEDVPGLLSKVADLIGLRALRILGRQLRHAGN